MKKEPSVSKPVGVSFATPLKATSVNGGSQALLKKLTETITSKSGNSQTKAMDPNKSKHSFKSFVVKNRKEDSSQSSLKPKITPNGNDGCGISLSFRNKERLFQQVLDDRIGNKKELIESSKASGTPCTLRVIRHRTCV